MKDLVFLIDESKFICHMVEMSLKKEDLSTFTLQSLENAIELIQELTPQILILDLQTLLKYDPQKSFWIRLKELPFIDRLSLFALGNKEDFLNLFLEGERNLFQELLEKPLSPTRLAERITQKIH